MYEIYFIILVTQLDRSLYILDWQIPLLNIERIAVGCMSVIQKIISTDFTLRLIQICTCKYMMKGMPKRSIKINIFQVILLLIFMEKNIQEYRPSQVCAI